MFKILLNSIVLTILDQLICRGITNFGTRCMCRPASNKHKQIKPALVTCMTSGLEISGPIPTALGEVHYIRFGPQ